MTPLDRSDLHLHSIYSDGLATPQDLCARAIRERLWAFALTDHDTTAGCAPVAEIAEKKGLFFVPGCEMSSGASGTVHLLCYGPGVFSKPVSDWALSVCEGRPERAMQMVQKLRDIGVCLSDESVEKLKRPGVGRMHVARQLVEEHFCKSPAECFAKYLQNGACCYVPLNLPSASDTVAALAPHCRVVLAHPMRLGLRMNEVFSFILSLKKLGLWGVECYHPSAAHAQSRLLASFAEREGLRVTGGSDDHSGGRKCSMGDFYRHGENMRETIAEMME